MKKLDCVDKAISRMFGSLGAFIARRPLPFLIGPLCILFVLCFGLIWLTIDDDVEYLFTPKNSMGRVDLKTAAQIFMAGSEGEDFLPNRELDLFLGRGRLILSRLDGGNILDPEHPEYMEDVYNLDKLIRSTPVPGNDSTFDNSLCMKWLDKCVPNPIMVFYDNHKHEYEAGFHNLTYPVVEIEIPIDISMLTNLSNLPSGKVIGGMDQWANYPMPSSMPPVGSYPNAGDANPDLEQVDPNILALMQQQQQNGGVDNSKPNQTSINPAMVDPDQLAALKQSGGAPANGDFQPGLPQNLPPGFDPRNLPPGIDPQNPPPGFDPQNLPPGFDPQNLPPGFDPGSGLPPDIPQGFNPGSNNNHLAALLGGGGAPKFTQQLFLGPNLGGVEFYSDSEDVVKSATHVSLFYTLTSGPEDMDIAHMWEDEVFMKVTEDYKNKTTLLKIDRVVSTSLASEVNEATHKVIPRFATTFIMMILFAVFSCIMRDWVLSKPWLGFLGVMSAAISIISSIGLLCFCGMKYNEVVSLMPFLIIGKLTQ